MTEQEQLKHYAIFLNSYKVPDFKDEKIKEMANIMQEVIKEWTAYIQEELK